MTPGNLISCNMARCSGIARNASVTGHPSEKMTNWGSRVATAPRPELNLTLKALTA
jgi:hypothetical protein